MASWKTTTLGVITIIMAVLGGAKQLLSGGGIPDITSLIAAITAGVGLIAARDNGVSSEQAGAK